MNIKPCPFCWSTRCRVNWGGFNSYAFVECVDSECGAEGPRRTGDDAAISAWNQRATPSAEAAQADAARWKYAEAHLFRCDPDMGGNHRWWTQHLRGRGPTVAAVIDKEIADYTARKEAAESKIAEMEGATPERRA